MGFCLITSLLNFFLGSKIILIKTIPLGGGGNPLSGRHLICHRCPFAHIWRRLCSLHQHGVSILDPFLALRAWIFSTYNGVNSLSPSLVTRPDFCLLEIFPIYLSQIWTTQGSPPGISLHFLPFLGGVDFDSVPRALSDSRAFSSLRLPGFLHVLPIRPPHRSPQVCSVPLLMSGTCPPKLGSPPGILAMQLQ